MALHRYVRKSLKILLWILGIVTGLILLVYLLIQVPAIQRMAKNKVVNFLEEKIKTPVVIEDLSVDFPKRLVLKGVYFEDQAGDTLLAGDTLKVDLIMWKLLSNQVVINEIDLRGITAYVKRTLPDSAFNFDYIIKAFIREEKTGADLDTTAMRFSVSKINLDRIRIHVANEVTGNNINAYLKHFDTEITKFDLEEQKFTVPKIKLDGFTASLKQTKALSRETVTTDTINVPFVYPDIEIKEIDISSVLIDYDNTVTAINSNLNLSHLRLEFDELDLPNQEIDLRLFQLDSTSGFFALGETAQQAVKSTATEVTTALEKGWTIQLDKLGIHNIDYKFDDLNDKKIARGIDYNHIDLKDLIVEGGGIYYVSDSVSGKISKLSATEKSGLDVKHFHGDFGFGGKSTSLQDFVIETSHSYISNQVKVTYPSLDTLSKDIGVVGINAHFTDTRIAFHDILLFAPSLARRPPFNRSPNGAIWVNGNVNGLIRDIRLSDFTLSGLGDLQFRGTGHITGLPDVNSSHFNLQIDHLRASERDIRSFIPPGAIPSNIRLPSFVEAEGRFKGTLSSFDADLNLRSSFGDAQINGTLKNITVKGRETYDATFTTKGFDLGHLIMKEEEIGRVSINATIQGSGTDPKTANATFKGEIVQAEYKGYNYKDIVFDGKAQRGEIELKASSRDPNITIDIDGTTSMNGQYPKLNAIINIENLEPYKLHLSEKDVRFKGKIIADLETADPDYLNGTINIADLIVRREGEQYRLDTISIVSVATPAEDSIEIKAEFMTMQMKGQYNLTDIMPALQGTINQYFNTTPGTNITEPFEPQQIEFTLYVTRSPLIEELYPNITEMEDIKLSGNFSSTTGELKVEGEVPRMKYKEFLFNELALDIHTENEALQYAVNLDQVTNPKFEIINMSLSGKAQNDILDVKLLVQDTDEKDQYRIAGELTSSNDYFEYKLLPDGLLLNYQPWNVAPNNSIQFGNDGLMVSNFNISHGAQSLTINSEPRLPDAPLDIQFSDFEIETVTYMVTKDSLFAGGTVNGIATLRDMKSNLVFTSDLTIDNFSLQGDTVGNVALKVNNEKADTYAADIRITGYGNEVNITGYYFDAGDKSNYNLDVDIVRMNLKSIEGFTMGELDKSTGTIDGKLAITGTSLTPDVSGQIHFRDAGFVIRRFNSFYQARDETIRFTPDGIVLDDFTLVDSAGNEAIFSGMVYTEDFKDYRFDLDAEADDFQVLNSTRDNNKLYFGRLFIDMDLHIKGGLNTPVVDGLVRVNEKTKMTIVIPQEDPGIVEREGIVEFVDMDTFQFETVAPRIDSLTRTQMIGMNIAVNIAIDKEAELSLVIDEANGDYLNVKGTANLTGGIDPSGKASLTGTYELEQGTYSFSFNQLKREFEINKGSTITWTGDAINADVNVTAVYNAEIAPLSLVQSQLADAEQTVINYYKQKIPFEILLTMEGKLLHPEITFDIVLGEGNLGVSGEVVSTVESKLVQLRSQPSELNKQVFAVLLLNRFIADDPFQNAAGGSSISSLARQSASKILSEQLNNLVGGMIAGVDVNFDINTIEDYTTGELRNRTDLTVGVSKQLLDDRLKVTVGSDFELEGPQQADRKTTNIAGDISAEYQLSKDERYTLRAYRKDEYIIVQGQVIETGIGFIFTADYDKVKDLFGRKTEEQKFLKKAERQARKQEKKAEKDAK